MEENNKTLYIKQPEGGLLQSHEWMSVLRAEGEKIIEISNNDKTIYGVVHSLPIVGSYVYFPRLQKLSSVAAEEIKKLKYSWVRFDANNKKVIDVLEQNGMHFTKAPHEMQPRQNLIINITEPEGELLAQMKSKHRYNIKLAQKKGVKVFITRDKKYIDRFCELIEETAKRKKIVFHKRDHYYKIFENMPKDFVQLYVAEYEGEVIAANIISFYGDVATYLHGATSDKFRNIMAPFLLQWRAMQDAKARGCQRYDLGGIFPKSYDAGKKGITRFKQGFSSKTSIFVTEGSYDIVNSSAKYNLYRVLQYIKQYL